MSNLISLWQRRTSGLQYNYYRQQDASFREQMRSIRSILKLESRLLRVIDPQDLPAINRLHDGILRIRDALASHPLRADLEREIIYAQDIVLKKSIEQLLRSDMDRLMQQSIKVMQQAAGDPGWIMDMGTQQQLYACLLQGDQAFHTQLSDIVLNASLCPQSYTLHCLSYRLMHHVEASDELRGDIGERVYSALAVLIGVVEKGRMLLHWKYEHFDVRALLQSYAVEYITAHANEFANIIIRAEQSKCDLSGIPFLYERNRLCREISRVIYTVFRPFEQ